MGIGDWGLWIVDWGLWIGDCGLGIVDWGLWIVRLLPSHPPTLLPSYSPKKEYHIK
jgi:hypothetical protein